MYQTGLNRFKCKKTGHGPVSVLRITIFDVDRFRPVFSDQFSFLMIQKHPATGLVPILPKKAKKTGLDRTLKH
jgi:hypothetical protein